MQRLARYELPRRRCAECGWCPFGSCDGRVSGARPAVDEMTAWAADLGLWASITYGVLSVAYAVAIIGGFVSNRSLKDPVGGPHLVVAEALILVMAPVLLTLSAAIHYSSPLDQRPFTLISLAFVTATVTTTSIVHFVELAVARGLTPNDLPAHERVFGFRWPSVFYAIDIVAWDVFFALALLFAAAAFDDETAVQAGLIASGILSLAGLVGPLVGRISLRGIGIIGYGVVFPITCIPLSAYFANLR